MTDGLDNVLKQGLTLSKTLYNNPVQDAVDSLRSQASAANWFNPSAGASFLGMPILF